MLETVIGLMIATVIALCVWAFLRPRLDVVPEEERRVIYRMGQFDRIVGPGPVVLLERLEKIRRTIKVRNEPTNFIIEDLYVYDVPFKCKLNYWSCFDPNMLKQRDPKLLAELAQFEDSERRHHAIIKVRDALVNSLAKVVSEQSEAPETLLEKLLLVVPGLDSCKRVIAYMEDELANTLPTIGYEFDRRQPLTITKLIIPPHIIGIFTRDQITEQISSKFPHISEETMLQAVSAFEGVNALNMVTQNRDERVRISSDGLKTEQDFRHSDRGTNIRTKIRPEDQSKANEESEQSETAKSPLSETGQSGNYKLTPADLAVLKRVA